MCVQSWDWHKLEGSGIFLRCQSSGTSNVNSQKKHWCHLGLSSHILTTHHDKTRILFKAANLLQIRTYIHPVDVFPASCSVYRECIAGTQWCDYAGQYAVSFSGCQNTNRTTVCKIFYYIVYVQSVTQHTPVLYVSALLVDEAD